MDRGNCCFHLSSTLTKATPPFFLAYIHVVYYFRHAADKLEPIFSKLVLTDQQCFRGAEGSETLLSMIPTTKVVDDLREAWATNPHKSSDDKWRDLEKKAEKNSIVHRAVCFFNAI
jgi:hypothetical protein